MRFTGSHCLKYRAKLRQVSTSANV
ncbi:hypothetical protein BBta_6683 [Bradyrhizobium sp. BTAi1]|nr:hypothetical protein BBta_6683 [Bradyrhizobium sp. BTAi1]